MFSLDQYDAARHAAALFNRSSQGKIELTGADRASFLHALLTNDIAGLAAGSGTYAAYLTPQGRMISDMRVLETGEAMLLDVEQSVAAALAARLESLVFSEDVQVRDITADYGELSLQGPTAAGVLEQVMGIPIRRLQSLKPYDNLRAPGSSITIVADRRFGVEGFDVYVPIDGVEKTSASMIAAGAVEAGDDVAEVLRIEAGRPRFGVDMLTDTIPLEAGIEDRAISLTKGCYVGQEVIVRILHRGHGRVARRLVGLLFDGGAAPAPGDAIFAGDEDVGRITSAVLSPRFKAPLALGYVRREHASPETLLIARRGETPLAARVHQFQN